MENFNFNEATLLFTLPNFLSLSEYMINIIEVSPSHDEALANPERDLFTSMLGKFARKTKFNMHEEAVSLIVLSCTKNPSRLTIREQTASCEKSNPLSSGLSYA